MTSDAGILKVYLVSLTLVSSTAAPVLSFTVRAEDTEELLGQGNGVKTDVKVEIITDGVFVIGINLSYGIPGDEENNVSESTVSISVVYTYDFEQISID